MILLLISPKGFSQQTIVLPYDGSSSQQHSPQGALRFQRQFYLVTPAEMQLSGLTNGMVINSIGFTLGAAQNDSTKGMFRVYLQNTTDIVSRTDTAWTTVTTATNSYNAIHLVPGNYEWQVISVCSAQSPDTAKTTFSNGNLGTCNPPTNFITDSITDNAAKFIWTAPTNAVTRYLVQYSRIDTVNWISDTSDFTYYHATGLLPNKFYQWKVRSQCSSDSSSPIGTSFSTSPSIICTPPNSLISSTTDTTATLLWNPPVPGPTSRYDLQYRRAGTTSWQTTTSITNNVTLHALKAGTTYEWQVRSNCSGGVSRYIAGANFNTSGTPACYAPTNLVTNNITDSSAQFAWTGYPGASSYTIRYRLKESISWTNVINGMTLANNDSLAIPDSIGPYVITFGGGSTFTYTGSGLYIAWEYSRATGPLSSLNTTLCTTKNTSIKGVNGQDSLRFILSLGASSQTATPTILTSSNLRPETRLGSPGLTDVAEVSTVYATGFNAIPYGNPTSITALVKNHSSTAKTFSVALSVKAQVSGNIRFADTSTVTINGDSAVVVSFNPWSPTLIEKDSIIVSVPPQAGENILTNNSAFYLQKVNQLLQGYADTSNAITTTGFDTLSGLLLNRYVMNGCGRVNSVQVFLSSSTNGHTVHGVILNAAGTIIDSSANYTPDSTSTNSYHTFYFPTTPYFKDSKYYVGLSQAVSHPGYLPVGVQWETAKVRDSAYFKANLDGSGLASLHLPGRLMIRAELLSGTQLPFITGKLTFCQGTTDTLVATTMNARFASSVLAFSSQNSNISFGAIQALGAPNTYPGYGSSADAWLSTSPDGQREFLELGFANPSPANFVDIYETFNPGAVDTVYVLNANTSTYVQVYSTTATPAAKTSRIKHITFPTTAFPVSGVRIAINSQAVSGYNSIDAVAIGTIDTPANTTGLLWSTGSTADSIYITTGGTYTLSVTDANNCSATTSVNVVIPSQVPPIVKIDSSCTTCSLSTSICQGDSVKLISNQLTGNVWSTGATTRSIYVKTAGSYFVTYNDNTGCGVQSSVPTAILVNPLPVVTITGTLGICPGSSTTLDAGLGYSSYIWSTGATTQTIDVTAADIYSVTVKNSNGCSGSSSVTTFGAVAPTPTISGNTQFCPGGSTVLDAGAGYASYLWSNMMTTRTITVTTVDNYTVTVTNNEGCSGSTTVTTTFFSPPTPHIIGANAFCPGSSTLLDAGSGYSHYLWTTGATTETISVNIAGGYTVTVTDAHGCTGGTALIVGQYVAPIPIITGTTSFCAGGATLLDAGSGYNGYLWSGGQTTHSITVTVVGTYTVTVTDNHGCTGSTGVPVNANGGPPNTPGPITGQPTGVCNSLGNLYTITAVPNTTRYVWTAPAGSTIASGQGTTSVRINFGNSFGSGNIVVAAANACGQSPSYNPRILTVQGAPDVPGPINGQTTGLCGQTKSYSIGAIAGATGYIWAVPAGATILTSIGTSITVSFISSFTSGNITVAASNACGVSSSATPRTLFVQGAPNSPGAITGQVTGVCLQTGKIYSIVAIPEANSYVWTVPSGVTITAGQGTASVTVSFGSTFTTGNICVTALSGSCSSSSSCLLVSSKPLLPGSITGPASVCANQHVVYSIAAVIGASSYTWAVPMRAVITAGQGTTSINVTFGNKPGNVTVTAKNSCGNNGARSLAVVVPCTMAPVVNPVTDARSVPVTGEPTALAQALTVYPNPSNGNFTVRFDNNGSNYKMTITDAMNKTVYTRALQTKENYIDVDLSNLARGVYFIKLFDGSKTLMTKVVIQ